MNGQNSGWITAEYGMLPGCSDKRIQRDKVRTTGRTHEIQRLIGRSIRASLDLKALGPRTVQIDCDVIQADGGTRVASITGSYLALRLALEKFSKRRPSFSIPPSLFIAALSLGKVDGEILLDLNYPEDVKAEVDANIVMNQKMEFVELQGTAEKGSFRKEEWSKMLELAEAGVKQLFELQRKTLSEWGL
jgi:ribonuclease PH